MYPSSLRDVAAAITKGVAYAFVQSIQTPTAVSVHRATCIEIYTCTFVADFRERKKT